MSAQTAIALPAHAIIFPCMTHRIDSYLQTHPVGSTLEQPWVQLSEDTIRQSAVAFISAHRVAQFDLNSPVFEITPDFVGDVVHEPAQWSYVADRIRDFMNAGTRLAWVIDSAGE